MLVSAGEVAPVAPGPGDVARVLVGDAKGTSVRVLRVNGDSAVVQNVWTRVRATLPMASLGRLSDQSSNGCEPDSVQYVRSAVVFAPVAADVDAPSSVSFFLTGGDKTARQSSVMMPPGRAVSACVTRGGDVLVVLRGASGSSVVTVTMVSDRPAIGAVLEVPDAVTRLKSVDATRAVCLASDTCRALVLRHATGSLAIDVAVRVSPGAVDVDVLGDQVLSLYSDGRVEAVSVVPSPPEWKGDAATALVEVRAMIARSAHFC